MSTTTPNFASLTSKPMDDIKAPPPLPAGTYHGVIAASGQGPAYEYGETSQKKTGYVRYHIKLTAPGEDVPQDAVEDLQGIISKRTFRKDFYLTDDALFRLKNFLESCNVSTSGRLLGECIPEAVGYPILVQITQGLSQDGKYQTNDVRDITGE